MYRQHCPLVAFLIDCFISVQHTSVCPKGRSTPYLNNGGSCSMMIDLLILLRVNTEGCTKSYILPLQEVLIDIIVNFYPEMITAILVNILITCVLWPWGDLWNVGHWPLGTPKVGILFREAIRRCSKKNHENILKGGFTRRKKEMPIICYELGNYYIMLTNIVFNVHAFENVT